MLKKDTFALKPPMGWNSWDCYGAAVNEEQLLGNAEYVRDNLKDFGWEYMLDYFGYSYFRKSASQMTDNEEEIFCDDNSRLEMLERVYKGRVIPLFVIFFTILVPQLIFSIVIYESPFLTVLYSVMLVIYLSLFIGFAKKYKKLKDNVK